MAEAPTEAVLNKINLVQLILNTEAKLETQIVKVSKTCQLTLTNWNQTLPLSGMLTVS